jgi:outer membrane protein insertion porin family
MKLFFRLFGLWLLLGCAQLAWAQAVGPKIDRVDIKFVGPASISEQFIRSNVRVKAGDVYLPDSTQDDIKALYGTGQFYNIRVTADPADDGGVIVTFIVQARPRISAINIEGNKKLSDSKLKKKITVKVGDPLDEQKLFTDAQEMKKLYEKYGYPDTEVKYVVNIDEAAGRGSATFEITESPKIKIVNVEFVGAAAFSQKELRKQIKTKRHWWLSWMTGSGVFKQDDFDDDRDQLTEFYRSRGYLDFDIKDVKLEHPTPKTMVVRYYIYEGRQYKVGAITFLNAAGSKTVMDQNGEPVEISHTNALLLPTNAVAVNFKAGREPKPKNSPAHARWVESRQLNQNFTMKTGATFTPDGLTKDTKAVEDFYGAKGYIDVAEGDSLRVEQVPNVDTGTMDLQFQIDEGEKSYVEKIEIRGNLKTKDKVIRRELAISPGEVFDMVKVDISKQRLENLQYFDKVDARPEPTDPPIAGRKNLVINVEEQNTGNLTVGAGFSTVDSLVGYVEITQGNFDLFNPPYFTGAGQKLRLFVQLGTERQDYEINFIEPWFLNRKLSLNVDLYRHELDFVSPNNIYDETRTGVRLSLERALWSDFLIGSVSYSIEDVGIALNSPFHGGLEKLTGNPPVPTHIHPNVPSEIMSQLGDHFYQRFGGTLAYDTRNSTRLPNHGQRTELDLELSEGDTTYYKLEAKTAWYFPGFFKGHVIELVGFAGTADSLSGGDVPFYDRYYLGGASDLRGFKFRNVAPREPGFKGVNEPIGGDSYWFGSMEYSIPIIEKENGLGLRVAAFYDVGAVGADSYSFSGNFDDDWGLGLRLNIPHLGPLRLDYGIPITHDKNNSASGQFQFSVGYTRDF